MSFKKSSHIVWIGPPDRMFFRSQGEVKCRPGNVIPKLVEQGYKLNVLLAYDASLLPKTKLSASRISHHVIQLDKAYPIQITKLSRGNLFPGIYMMEPLNQNAAMTGALLAKAALSLVKQLKRSVDVFHLFDAHAGLFPLYLREERAQSRLLRDARTLVTVSSLREFGAFSPALFGELNIAPRYFTPGGVEFYGKASALKAALQFCDRIAIVEGSAQSRATHRNGATMDGVVAANASKVTAWLSDRSVKAHVDMYQRLLQTAPESAFQNLEKEQHSASPEDPIQKAIQMWGPFPPERYGVRSLSLLVQSPKKAYAFWEWSDPEPRHLGLFLENGATPNLTLLAERLTSVGEYWFNVEAAGVYTAVLAERLADGSWKPLLRSAAVRVPRDTPSANRSVVFIDARTKTRTAAMTPGDIRVTGGRVGDGTSAWEWTTGSLTQTSTFSLDNPTSPGV
jgi:hypothetical protein